MSQKTDVRKKSKRVSGLQCMSSFVSYVHSKMRRRWVPGSWDEIYCFKCCKIQEASAEAVLTFSAAQPEHLQEENPFQVQNATQKALLPLRVCVAPSPTYCLEELVLDIQPAAISYD
jgi:hypothetical protein